MAKTLQMGNFLLKLRDAYEGTILRPKILDLAETREYYRGKYHCTIDLLFDWFGLACFTNKNKNCH